MAAGGIADDPDLRLVEPEPVGLGPYQAHRALSVLERGQQRPSLVGESIVQDECRDAVLVQPVGGGLSFLLDADASITAAAEDEDPGAVRL